MKPIIEFDDLRISETGKVLKGEIYPGITYLTGKNGAGKTLFLDILSGLRALPKGASIVFSKQDKIYMRQNFTCNFKLTVKEYLEFIFGLDNKKLDVFFSFIQTFYPDYDVHGILNKRIGLLSGGERQELYLLSILGMEREVYILDEPFSSIDIEKVKRLSELIESMSLFYGKSFIITSHITLNIDSLMVIDYEDLKIDC